MPAGLSSDAKRLRAELVGIAGEQDLDASDRMGEKGPAGGAGKGKEPKILSTAAPAPPRPTGRATEQRRHSPGASGLE